MSDPFVGEIRMFAGNFAPVGWAFCDGQLLAVSQNDALFSLLGTIYGGDGRTTFGLPDLRGRLALHAGSGPGLSPRSLGQKGGVEQVTLTTSTVPTHRHGMVASQLAANQSSPGGNVLADTSATHNAYNNSTSANIDLGTRTGFFGADNPSPHTNLMPSQCIHFIIALFGIYPSRT